MKTIKRAGELVVGDQVAEADGYLLTVKEIVKRTEKTITVKLTSDFSPMRAVRDGIVHTFRRTTRVVVWVETKRAASPAEA